MCLPSSPATNTILDKESTIQVKCLSFQKQNLILRGFYEIINVYKILNKIPKHVEIVFLTMPSMFLFFGLFFFRSQTKVVDIRDLTWEYLNNKSVINRFFTRLIRFLFARAIKYAAHILCTNIAEKRYLDDLIDHGCQKILHIPNGVSWKNYQSLKLLKPPIMHTCFDLVISYVGNIGLAQNLSTLLEVARNNPRIKFNLVGDGIEYQSLYNRFRNYENINFTGKVPWEVVLNIYQSSNVLYAQISQEFISAVPSKLYEYLATGRSIIYGGYGVATELLETFDGIYICEPDNIKSLHSVIEKIVKDDSFANYYPINVEKIEKYYIRENTASVFYSEIENPQES